MLNTLAEPYEMWLLGYSTVISRKHDPIQITPVHFFINLTYFLLLSIIQQNQGNKENGKNEYRIVMKYFIKEA